MSLNTHNLHNLNAKPHQIRMSKSEAERFCPKKQADWRKWLETKHQSKQSIWLTYYKASSSVPSLTWSQALDEALCFGWIDSTKKTIDKERYLQYFSKRKPTSTWSKINKDKIILLLQNNQMKQAGIDCMGIL